MMTIKGSIIVNNIKLPIDASHKEAFSVARGKLKALGVSLSDKTFTIYRRSIDARNKENIFFVWSVAVSGERSAVLQLRYPWKSAYKAENAGLQTSAGR